MSSDSAEFYPPADRSAQWFEDDWPGERMNTNTGCLHTTEGTGWPSYDGGATAPNLTARPDLQRSRLLWRQHFRANTSSRALRNLTGGVQTNTLNVIQVELVGTCDPTHAKRWNGRIAGKDYLFWPDAPGWALSDLARMFRWAFDDLGVPLTDRGLRWVAFPDSFGPGGQRMSGTKWRAFTGWCGHQHVPENVHGDPGNMAVSSALKLAQGVEPPAQMVTVRAGESLPELAKRIDSTTERIRLANLARFGGPLRAGEKLRRP